MKTFGVYRFVQACVAIRLDALGFRFVVRIVPLSATKVVVVLFAVIHAT